jgi:hypothetical protein
MGGDRALLSDDREGQQDILKDEPPFSGKLHAKGWQLLKGVDVSTDVILRRALLIPVFSRRSLGPPHTLAMNGREYLYHHRSSRPFHVLIMPSFCAFRDLL